MGCYVIVKTCAENIVPQLAALALRPAVRALIDRDNKLWRILKELEQFRFDGFHRFPLTYLYQSFVSSFVTTLSGLSNTLDPTVIFRERSLAEALLVGVLLRRTVDDHRLLDRIAHRPIDEPVLLKVRDRTVVESALVALAPDVLDDLHKEGLVHPVPDDVVVGPLGHRLREGPFAGIDEVSEFFGEAGHWEDFTKRVCRCHGVYGPGKRQE